MFRLTPPAFFISMFSILLFTSCIGNERAKLPPYDLDPQAVYLHYMVWGDEESGIVTVKLQYRRGGRDGDAFALQEPANVEFDGELMRVDSAGLNGPYYETTRWANEFDGHHTIDFTDLDKKQYKTGFDFPVISFKTELPAIINRSQDLYFELDGIQPLDKIRILFTDTSFAGTGIERIDTIQDGRIFFSQNNLSTLKNGPVYLEIFREQDIRLNYAEKRIGKLSLSYALKKEFMLE